MLFKFSKNPNFSFLETTQFFDGVINIFTYVTLQYLN